MLNVRKKSLILACIRRLSVVFGGQQNKWTTTPWVVIIGGTPIPIVFDSIHIHS